MSDTDAGWAEGDLCALPFPAHSGALRQGGADFLTTAFRASGALGSTGRKLLLRVVYERPAAHLPSELFVKFSRDFDDAIRDRGRETVRVRLQMLTIFLHLWRSLDLPAALKQFLHRTQRP